METEKEQHPPPLHLAALSLGVLKSSKMAETQAHLEQCSDCRSFLSDTPRSELAELVKQAKLKASAAQNTMVTGLSGTIAGEKMSPADLAPDGVVPIMPLGSASSSTPGPVVHEVSESDIPHDLYAQSKYRIIRVLGRGGMGVVYQAEHVRLRRSVAIKVINAALVGHPQALLRFEEESRSVALLSHENIARAYDAESFGSLQVLIMEFIQGQTLSDLLKSRGQLSIMEASNCICQALLGLQHASNKGLVHRDLKLQNLMLETATKRVKILDFGLAKMRERQGTPELTGTNQIMGTCEYMSPEQADDPASADIRADIYSLGCCLYYLIAGVLPFQQTKLLELLKAHLSETPRPLHEVRADVPEALSDLVAWMLAKKPEDRPATPRTAADVLMPFARGETVKSSAAKAKVAAPAAARSGINRGKWISIAVGIVALFGFGGWAAGLFTVHTPQGTIVVSGVPENAEVSVDDQIVNVTRNGDALTIEAVAKGPHRLKLVKNGQEMWSDDVAIEMAGQLVAARFQPKAVSLAPATPAVPGAPATEPGGKANDVAALFPMYSHWVGTVSINSKPTPAEATVVGLDGNVMILELHRQSAPVRHLHCVIDREHVTLVRNAAIGLRPDRGPPVNTSNIKITGSIQRDELKLSGTEDDSDISGKSLGTTQLDIALRRDAIANESRAQDVGSDKNPAGVVASSGFVSLFNGRNRDGWKTYPSLPGNWSVEGGVLKGSDISQLYSARNDYADVHLRVKLRMSADARFCLYVRGGYGPNHGGNWPDGLEITCSSTVKQPITGIVWVNSTKEDTFGDRPLPANEPIQADFAIQGDRAVVMIDGQVVSEYTDKEHKIPSRGHIILQTQEGTVSFESVEVKELAAGSVFDLPTTASTGSKRGLSAQPKSQPLQSVPSAAALRRHGNMQIDGGELVINSAGGPGFVFFGDVNWSDYEFRFKVCRATGTPVLGCDFRQDTKGTWGHFSIGKINVPGGFTQIGFKVVGKHGTGTGSPAPPIETGHWYDVLISCRGTEFRVLVDGKQVRQKNRADVTRGAVGLWASGNGTVRFKDITVTSPDGKSLWKGLPNVAASNSGVEVPDAAADVPDMEDDLSDGTGDSADENVSTGPGADEGFVKLFNGKDLAGWHEGVSSGVWKVKDGVLTGEGTPSYLCTDRKDYENVHIRARLRINSGGDSGIYARSTGATAAPGYEAQVNANGSDPLKTGSLWFIGGQQAASARAPKPNEWFTEELIANGGDLTVRVDGHETAHLVDKKGLPPGCVALEVRAAKTKVEFSSIEIKKLPAPVGNALAAGAPPPAGTAIDLLSQVQLPEDTVKGEWEKTNGGIESKQAQSILKLRYIPKGEYDFRVSFTCLSGNQIVDLLTSFGATRFAWIMHAKTCGFAKVDAKRFMRNESSRKISLNMGQKYLVEIKVRKDGVSAWIDQKEVSTLKTDYSNLSPGGGSEFISDASLGLSTIKSPTLFHMIEVVPIEPAHN